MKFDLKPRKITALTTAAFGIGGFFLGIPTMFIGLVLGYLVGCVFSQMGSDTIVYRYFENPGPTTFNEGEPGLAAFCALGIYLISKSSPKVLTDEAAAARVTGAAASVFPQGNIISPYAESFCRLAFDRLSVLNPDLLSESLLARRREAGDVSLMGAELSTMAIGKEAQQEAIYIRQFLEPGYEPDGSLPPEDDPWNVLGIAKGASYDEVKSVFRKLALLYHPDNQHGLEEEEQKNLSETFIKIRDAYRIITREITFG